MNSSVEVANAALTLFGDSAITALTEDADRARAIKKIYLPALDARLRGHDWNFARMRAQLVEVDATPEFGYDYMFQLPQDPFCLRVLSTDLDELEAWELETYVTASAQYRVLVTDASTVEIKYIARVEDPTLWDASFADAFVLELARKAVYAITRNATLAAELNAEADMMWKKARSVDGQEGRPLKSFLSNSFTRVR